MKQFNQKNIILNPFIKNLSAIDNTIKACKDELREAPDNKVLNASLSLCYRSKMKLYLKMTLVLNNSKVFNTTI